MNTLYTEDGLHWVLSLYDQATGDHCGRVGVVAGVIARQLGMTLADVRSIARAGHLHDIDKLDVPCHLLVKAGRLTRAERALMDAHPIFGVERLSGVVTDKIILAVVGAHHERWDGQGYPRGLAGEAIPLAARIVAVADVYDALREARPYKWAWGHAEALAYIEGQSGSMFDPTVVAAFAAAVSRFAITTTRTSQ